MSYPINDIFEGVGDLLQRHGKTVLSTRNLDLTSEIFVQYGDYSYILTYREGVLYSIHRMEVTDNGKD